MRQVFRLQMFRQFLRDESGATAIEYGLICAGLALAILTTLQALGTNLIAMLQSLLDFFP
jgi:pilus assembly protein Flp/PilA